MHSSYHNDGTGHSQSRVMDHGTHQEGGTEGEEEGGATETQARPRDTKDDAAGNKPAQDEGRQEKEDHPLPLAFGQETKAAKDVAFQMGPPSARRARRQD